MAMNATPQPKIDLIAIDIDGTLLDPSSQLTSGVEKAVKAAAAQGVQIIMATGKTRGSALPFLKKLGIEAPGIYVQGTVTHNADGGIRSQVTLPDAVVRQVVTFVEDRGFAAALYSGSRIMMRTPHERIIASMRFYHEVEPEVVGPLQNLIGKETINKLIVMGEPRAITALRWQLNLQVGSSARVVQAGVADMLEVIPNGVSKASALKRLSYELNIPPERIMAIGDAENDIEMLQYAGVSVAMGHADDRVKAAAKHVVGSNKDDGVAEALRKFVLPPPPPPPAPVEAAPATAPDAAAAGDATVNAAAPSAEAKPKPKKAAAPATPGEAAENAPPAAPASADAPAPKDEAAP